MSAITETAHAPQHERTVKHPMAWYMPRFWHGMRLTTWLRELGRNRLAVSPSRVPMTCAVTGFTALNSLLAGVDRAVYGRKVAATDLAAPPVFILGHWRSGTTWFGGPTRDPDGSGSRWRSRGDCPGGGA